MPVTTANLRRAIRKLLWGDASMTEFAGDVAGAFASTATLIDSLRTDLSAIDVTGGSGDVVGPASATDGHVALFDGATGKLIKDGGALPTSYVAPYYGVWPLPTAGNAGRPGYVTDSPQGEWVDSGTAWRPVIRGVVGTAPPAAATFTRLNATAATLSDNKGTLQIVSALAGTNEAWSYSVAPAATFKWSTAFMAQWVDGGAGSEGMYYIMVRESGTGHFYLFGCYCSGTTITLLVTRQSAVNTNAGGGTSAVAAVKVPQVGSHICLRIQRDATNLIFQYSNDIQPDDSQWATLFTEAKAAYVTVDQVGVGTNRTAGLTFKADIYDLDLT